MPHGMTAPDRLADANFYGSVRVGWSCALYAYHGATGQRLGLLSWRPGDEAGAQWECNCGARGQAQPPAAAAAELLAHHTGDEAGALDIALTWANRVPV